MVAATVQTTMRAHQWGVSRGKLLRASTVMEFCDSVLKQIEQLIEIEERENALAARGGAK